MTSTYVDRYGFFDFDFKFENEKFTLEFEKEFKSFKYTRSTSSANKKITRINYDELDSIIIQPSEPLLLDFPKTHLLIEFVHPLQLVPNSELFGFIEFPISISTIINVHQKNLALDIFHLNPVKFALYGNPHNGLICRYWKTEFFTTPFKPKLFETGLLEIEIQNLTSNLVNLTKLVFDFSHILIYYDDNQAKASSRAKIQSESYCETEFIKPINIEGFKQTFDLIPTKLLTSSKLIMSNGI